MSKNRKVLKIVSLITVTAFVATFAYSVYHKPETNLVETNIKMDTTEPNAILRDSIVEYGTIFLGTPYVAAGCSKDGFDCSGFVYFVFKHYDIEVPRSSSGFANFGTEIPIEEVQKGDILVFLSPTRNAIGHVGIVSNPKGKESDFIHASSSKEMKVVITSLLKEGYKRRFIKAVRVL